MMISTMKGAFTIFLLTCCLFGCPSEGGSLAVRWFALYQSYYGSHPRLLYPLCRWFGRILLAEKYPLSANSIDCSGYGFHENQFLSPHKHTFHPSLQEMQSDMVD